MWPREGVDMMTCGRKHPADATLGWAEPMGEGFAVAEREPDREGGR